MRGDQVFQVGNASQWRACSEVFYAIPLISFSQNKLIAPGISLLHPPVFHAYSLRLSKPLNPCLSMVGVVGLLLDRPWSTRGVFSRLPPPVPGVISKKPFSLSTIVFSKLAILIGGGRARSLLVYRYVDKSTMAVPITY